MKKRQLTGAPEASLSVDAVAAVVEQCVNSTACVDMHTHLYPPAFGKLGLWGIDELLTYHYLEAEFFRFSEMQPAQYFSLSKREKAEAIWRSLFVENSPISEATRGVIAVLQALGLPTDARALNEARGFFANQDFTHHIHNVLQLAAVKTVVMTNDPLDPEESALWINGAKVTPEFLAVIRLDRLLSTSAQAWEELAKQGYEVDREFSAHCISELRRFLSDWHRRVRPVYMAVSLPDTFQFPSGTVEERILRETVLPACRELNLPLSLMIGVRRQVNPRIRLAGDAAGKADLRSVENLCRDFPDNRFLVSVLSRENQHEMCVYARKFSNLMPFGCWWFLNNPSIVEEITRERLEMLGASFIPQHSDARVLEQLIYKWRNTRRTLTRILTESYQLALTDGVAITQESIARDIRLLLGDNFNRFVARK